MRHPFRPSPDKTSLHYGTYEEAWNTVLHGEQDCYRHLDA